MYGTTMKNYSARRASDFKDEKKARASKKEKRVRKLEDEDTRYVKKASKADVINNVEEQVELDTGFSRKDFPVTSVVITILTTMMLLVVAVGLLGV